MSAARLVDTGAQSGSTSPDYHNIWSRFLQTAVKTSCCLFISFFFNVTLREMVTLHTSSNIISRMLWGHGGRMEQPGSPVPPGSRRPPPQPPLSSISLRNPPGLPLVTASSGGSEKQSLSPFIASLPIHLFYFLPCGERGIPPLLSLSPHLLFGLCFTSSLLTSTPL